MMLSRLTFALLLGAGAVSAADTQDPLVAQGAYLSKVGDCAACHTAEGGQKYAGGLAFKTPFGVIYSTNISSDKNQGIGSYSYEDFYEVMHNGNAPKGRLYPAMPYTSYHMVTDEDMKALYAYFMQTRPAATPNRDNEVGFPFNVRTGLVWATKILTDPFHDIKLYHKAPLHLLRGQLIDPGIGHRHG